jgi:glycoprotein-N-acetylgalactosamine 3-beta-galactosyltransferase
MWQKVRSIWSFLYDNFYDKYDWFHIGGDDMYVITENLRQYLESDEIRAAANGGLHLPDGTETAQVPLYLGRQFANRGKLYDLYNSGGPGYTLNRAALKTLVVLGLPKYYTNTVGSVEDIMVGRILRKFNVLPYDTRDNSGGDRYMHFSPAKHYVLQREESQNITSVFNDWYRSISGRVTPDSTAARCIAFHYLKTKDMQRMHALLYGYCGALLIRASGEG